MGIPVILAILVSPARASHRKELLLMSTVPDLLSTLTCPTTTTKMNPIMAAKSTSIRSKIGFVVSATRPYPLTALLCSTLTIPAKKQADEPTNQLPLKRVKKSPSLRKVPCYSTCAVH